MKFSGPYSTAALLWKTWAKTAICNNRYSSILRRCRRKEQVQRRLSCLTVHLQNLFTKGDKRYEGTFMLELHKFYYDYYTAPTTSPIKYFYVLGWCLIQTLKLEKRKSDFAPKCNSYQNDRNEWRTEKEIWQHMPISVQMITEQLV